MRFMKIRRIRWWPHFFSTPPPHPPHPTASTPSPMASAEETEHKRVELKEHIMDKCYLTHGLDRRFLLAQTQSAQARP